MALPQERRPACTILGGGTPLFTGVRGRDEGGKQFWINILLTILGYIPGIVHAVWVIAKY